MLRTGSSRLFPAVLSAVSLWGLTEISQTVAQDLPTSQPKILTIYQERIKTGRSAEHARNEAQWSKAVEKGKSGWYYLAITSLTGPSEAWYIGHFDSHTALGERMRHDDNDPLLSAENERFARADAEFVSESRSIEMRARPDLSYGTFPDLSKARFYEITTFTVRPGHERQFAAAAKAYAAATQRAGAKTAYRTYEVTAGLPGSIFMVFSSVESYGQFDQSVADDMATVKAATPEELASLEKCMKDDIISTEKNRFRIDAEQSYLSKETRDKDPDFWKAK